MVSSAKMPSAELALVRQAENLRQRPGRRVALEPLHGARREHEHAVRRLAAQHLLPGPGDDVELVPWQIHREDAGGRIANRQALAIGFDPIAVRDAYARGRAVPREDHVAIGVDLREIGNLAVRRAEDAQILDLELLLDIGDPAFAEAFPGQRVDAARAEQRPEDHLDRARIGGRRDGEAVIFRHPQKGARAGDDFLEAGLAELRAMRAPEQRILQRRHGITGALGTRTRGEIRAGGPALRLHDSYSFQNSCAPLGGRVPPRKLSDGSGASMLNRATERRSIAAV